MSAELVKRSQYFNPPSTECPHSSRNHFEDWEEFHLPMARMHHVALHGRGVATGLAVSVQEGGTQIEVGPGVAIVGNGELIALSDAGQADVGIDGPGEADQQIGPPFRLGTAGRENGPHYLCIQFAQALRFAEGSCGKLEQTPWLRLLPTAGDLGPIETGEALVLAIAEVDADGIATVRDRAEGLTHRRELLGQGTGELRIRRTAAGSETVADAPSGRIAAGEAGGLRLSVAAAADAMILDREDGGRFSRLEIQADDVRLGGSLEVPETLGLAGWRLRAGGSEAAPTLELQPRADRGFLKVRDASGTREVMLGVDEAGGVISTTPEHDLQVRVGDTAAMTLKADGRVGIGTAAPGERLEVEGRIKAGHLTVGDWPAAPDHFVYFGTAALDQNDHRNYALAQDSAGRTYLNSPTGITLKIADLPTLLIGAQGKLILGSRGGEGSIGLGVNPIHPISLAGGAHCFEGREWRNASSISCKKDIKDLRMDDALAALEALRPVTFTYVDGDETRAGFIAEEMPDLLATGDRTSLSPMEIVAVLAQVVKAQQSQIHELAERLGSGSGDMRPAGLQSSPPPAPCAAQG
ncbi:MAG TPA: tail fiber domain-containing protein [Geminicoccaceae bacterium]|nr:tail fiber domain-containing protein [Geminicoccaceae bacterium]